MILTCHKGRVNIMDFAENSNGPKCAFIPRNILHFQRQSRRSKAVQRLSSGRQRLFQKLCGNTFLFTVALSQVPTTKKNQYKHPGKLVLDLTTL